MKQFEILMILSMCALIIYNVEGYAEENQPVLDAGFYFNRGLAHEKKGQYDEAISDFTKAIEIKPNYARAYRMRGEAYFNKGQYDKAIPDLKKAIGLILKKEKELVLLYKPDRYLKMDADMIELVTNSIEKERQPSSPPIEPAIIPPPAP